MSISETAPDVGTRGGGGAAPVRAGLFVERADGVHLCAGECTRCGVLTFPVQAVCPNCQHTEPRTRELSRTGTVFSFTVVRSRPPNYHGPVPYGLGLVELPEGLLVTSMLLADDYDGPDRLDIGDRVVTSTVGVGAENDPLVSYAFERAAEDR